MDLETRVLPDEDTRGAGVVEVDVAEEEVADVGRREPTRREALLECREIARRAAVEERRPVLGLEQVAADDAFGVEVVEVD